MDGSGSNQLHWRRRWLSWRRRLEDKTGLGTVLDAKLTASRKCWRIQGKSRVENWRDFLGAVNTAMTPPFPTHSPFRIRLSTFTYELGKIDHCFL